MKEQVIACVVNFNLLIKLVANRHFAGDTHLPVPVRAGQQS